MNMSRRARWAPVGTVLLLASLLAVLFGGFVRDAIIVPLLHAYWVARLYVESLSQQLIWGAFVALALFVIARSAMGREGPPYRRPGEALPERVGPVKALAEHIRLAARGEYFRRRVARRCGELAVEVLAHRDRMPRERVRERLERGELEVPAQIQDDLREGLKPRPAQPPTWGTPFSRILRRIDGGSPIARDVESAIRFLEARLGLRDQQQETSEGDHGSPTD